MAAKPPSRTAMVVISHYNAWPTDHLVALLDQARAIPAGRPFRLRVVVNQAEPKALELPPRHAQVEVLHRENTGYNIGAWDQGWREPPRADDYLFLQEECVIRKPGWLAAFLGALARPGVGLAGESLEHPTLTWERYSTDPNSPWNAVDWPGGQERPKNFAAFARDHLTKIGIEPGATVGHLQALVLAAPVEVLEKIGGFPVGISKDEAVASEIGISKAVEAIGKKVVQLRVRPFEYILHPQWESARRDSAGMAWWLKRVARDYLKRPLKALAGR